MKLQEYQSKRLFARYGVPIPQGDVATSPAEARTIAEKLGKPVVIKSQVLVGGRGKAGGIKLASTPAEAEERARQILGMDIKGLSVKKVLVDEAADIKEEIYLGMTLDRAKRRVVMIGSSAGGVDIEEVAAKTPEKIITIPINPFLGLKEYQAREMAFTIGIRKELVRDFVKIAMALYAAFEANDGSLAEINPLAVLGNGKLLAADGKMVIDDNALFRHADLEAERDSEEETESERIARAADLSYIQLDGEIGCMVNGAGLAMATMDIVKYYGGSPANFLDVGGGADADKVATALRIILSDKNVKAVLFNIFGGITRADQVALGIIQALKDVPTPVPMVARLLGTNEEEGRRILASAKMETASTLAEAAQKAVAAARGAHYAGTQP